MLRQQRLGCLLGSLLLLVLIVVGIAATINVVIPGGLFGNQTEQHTFEASDSWVVLTITPADVGRLPEDFVDVVLADQPPLTLDQAIEAPIDVLLMHRQTLVEIAADDVQRGQLNDVIEAGKMVVVYDIPSTKLQDALDGPILVAEPLNPGRVAASVLNTSRGVRRTGHYFISAEGRRMTIGNIYGYVELSLADR